MSSRLLRIDNFGLGEKGRHRSNLWTYAGANTFRAGRMDDLEAHPTVKPVDMISDAIMDCSKRGGIVADAFAGSGTTLLAAAKTGRIGVGVTARRRPGPKPSAIAKSRRVAEQAALASE